jgi:hypothetical protein
MKRSLQLTAVKQGQLKASFLMSQCSTNGLNIKFGKGIMK